MRRGIVRRERERERERVQRKEARRHVWWEITLGRSGGQRSATETFDAILVNQAIKAALLFPLLCFPSRSSLSSSKENRTSTPLQYYIANPHPTDGHIFAAD